MAAAPPTQPLSAGLRIAIVDIDAHVGNGTQVRACMVRRASLESRQRCEP